MPHAANNQVGSTPPEGLSSSHGGVGNNHNNKQQQQQQQLSANSQEVIQQQQHIVIIFLLFKKKHLILISVFNKIVLTNVYNWICYWIPKGAELIKASRQQPTRLAFVLELTATRDWRWEGVLWRGRLYLEVPSRLVQTGSKEGFVALLEYAEEELQCSHVILALSKDRADRADVIRTFMFLGFSILPPGHQLVPANSNNLFLACSLEWNSKGIVKTKKMKKKGGGLTQYSRSSFWGPLNSKMFRQIHHHQSSSIITSPFLSFVSYVSQCLFAVCTSL